MFGKRYFLLGLLPRQLGLGTGPHGRCHRSEVRHRNDEMEGRNISQPFQESIGFSLISISKTILKLLLISGILRRQVPCSLPESWMIC
ncbi:MAG: hypothetical protein DMG06_06850 [Acidobacteria bacterium]|nr:MAG: hypothetical protein DMG06_06850 [Acidobacteriota bacterium]